MPLHFDVLFQTSHIGGQEPPPPQSIPARKQPHPQVRPGVTMMAERPFVAACRIYQEMIGLEQFGRRIPDYGIRIPLRRLDLAVCRYI